MSLNDIVHDCYYDAKNSVPTEQKIGEIIAKIPKDIIIIGDQWGWNDTEFRDKLYIWINNDLV